MSYYDDLDVFLENLRDYFDGRADADCDQDGFIPNEEMRILCELDHHIAAREKAVRS
jgi:hypothetical protein